MKRILKTNVDDKILKRTAALMVLFLFSISSLLGFQSIQTNTNENLEKNLDDLQIQGFQYSNQTERIIILFNDSIQASWINNFTSNGGSILSGPWNVTNGFLGIINASEDKLGEFLTQVPEASAYYDSIVEGQMNFVARQLNYYPGIWESPLNVSGNNNSTIALLDSGIDPSSVAFQPGYTDANFSSKIVYWRDYIESNLTPIDNNGHGTAISAIAVGGGIDSEPYKEGETLYFTFGGNYSHYNLFYPNHLPKGTYRVKMASFVPKIGNYTLEVNASLNDFDVLTQLNSYNLTIYQGTQLLNQSIDLGNGNMSLILNMSTISSNFLDLYFEYAIEFAANPKFSVLGTGSYIANDSTIQPSNYTGIAYNSKIASLRVLNESNKGYLSDVISSLNFIWENNSKYHITTALLALGSSNVSDSLVSAVSQSIDRVIENGTLVIIAAGNYGVGSNKLNKLAMNSKAIVVGSVNDLNELTYYSAEGKILNDGTIKPDILAPGGSYLAGRRMIQSYDSNMVEPNGTQGSELIANDTTFVVGTSVSAAILSGVYQSLFDVFGNWSDFQISEDLVLTIKASLLASASETNVQREDNPITAYNEAINSPILNRIGKDIHEGFGIVNPKAALELLSTPFSMNSSITEPITAPNINSTQDHVIARKVTLEKNKYYQFSINSSQPGFDADLFLYFNVSDSKGEPLLIKAGANGFTADESFIYCPVNETREYWVIAKAVVGRGNLTLNITQLDINSDPVLSNESLTTSSDRFDILDEYTFQINYSHPENMPPQTVYLVTNVTMNFTMDQVDPFDLNYTDGTLFEITIKFNTTGNISYYFATLAGGKYVEYPLVNLSIFVSPINNLRTTSYITDFSDWASQSQYWIYDNSIVEDPLGMGLGNLTAGWEQLTISSLWESREQLLYPNNWHALYCGLSQSGPMLHSPIIRTDNTPYYDYTGMIGTFNLESPTFYVDSTQYPSLNAKFGYRVSLGVGSVLNVQVIVNRTEIYTIESHSSEEFGWRETIVDLTPYNNTYVQIRFNAILSGGSLNYKSGIMLDYFQVENMSISNNFKPYLENPTGISGSIDYIQNATKSRTKFDIYEFRVMVSDPDGVVPQYVMLEIDGKNFTMENIFGKWDAIRKNISLEKYFGIYYSIKLSLSEFKNLTYRFHAFDGKFYNSTSFIPFNITFETPSSLQYPVTKLLTEDDLFVGGTPTPVFKSAWLSGDNQWHRVKVLDSYMDETEWYCGSLLYGGYGSNWNATLSLKPVYINETFEAFLWFDYKLITNSPGDSLVIFVSNDLGNTWKNISTLTTITTDYTQYAIKLNQYKRQTIMIRFNFITDNIPSIGFVQENGVYLKNISINLNVTKDYIPPVVNILNLVENQKVSGKIKVQVLISDNIAVNMSRTEIYIDGLPVEFTTNNSIIEIEFDTTIFEDLYDLEIAVVAFDMEGNRLTKKLVVVVDNRVPWWIGALIASLAIASLFALNVYAKKVKVRDRNSIFAVGLFSKYEEWQRKKSTQRQHTIDVLDSLDKKVEAMIPMKLHCKSCKKWFSSNKFDIYCPSCGKDAIYIAKECPFCEKYYFFDLPGKHECKKHKIVLPNDYKKSMELMDEGHYSVEFLKEHPEYLKNIPMKREGEQ